MSQSKKNKNKNKKKAKKPQAEEKGDVLEKVLEGIEMAGASMDFFEGESDASQDSSEIEDPAPAEETLELASDQQGNEESAEMSNDAESHSDESTASDDGEGIQENLELTGESSDEDNPEPEFIEDKQMLSILESLLFSAEKPIGLGSIKPVFKGTNITSKDIQKGLAELQSLYAEPTRGVSLEEINGGWQLRTKADNWPYLKHVAKARPFKLSGPALEVMAIVAYKQPIVKAEVDEIRGVESGHLLRALMEKGLVSFQGKSELPGKPMQYGSTRKFLEIFGLRNLRELPSLDEIDQLLPDGIGDEEDKTTLSDVTDGLAEEYAGNYSRGEDELVKIQDVLEDIDTSSEFFEQEKQRQRDKRDRERAQDIREALTVGEEVDPKDEKWLARYEAKLQEAMDAENSQDGEASESSEDVVALGETPVSDGNEDAEEIDPLQAAVELLGEDGGDEATLDEDPDAVESDDSAEDIKVQDLS